MSSLRNRVPHPIRTVAAAPLGLAMAVLLLLASPAPAQYNMRPGSGTTAPAAAPATAAPAEEDHTGHNHAPGEGHGAPAHGPGDGHDHSFDGTVKPRPNFDYSHWEGIPIQEGGLEKSFLTFARDFVKEVTGRANYGGRSPIENYLSMAFEPEAWAREPILKVRHPALKRLYPESDHGRISPLQLDEKRENWSKLIEGPDGKAIEKELGKLYFLTDQIYGNEMLDPPGPSALERMKIVPAANFRGDPEVWRTVDELRLQVKAKGTAELKLIEGFNAARDAFYRRDAAAFQAASAQLRGALPSLPVQPSWPDWKFSLSRVDTKLGLFRVAGWTYLVAALVFLGSYLAGRRVFVILAGSLLGTGAALHLAALVIRGVLAGRNPVSNLFESAMFIIAGMTVFSLVISTYYRTRVVGLGGAALGAFFMGIANNMPLQYGEKILPLIDALQSYWLNIHVTAMLLSYAFFATAFFVELAYLGRMMLMRRRPGFDVANDETLQYLDSLNFRIITIGVPILTGGVILGAVWAAEAWGRPWAFDPKETASAITWMIYAFYLHARLFLGWRGPTGIWLSVLGFAAVVFTYLGVSFFLPGLHSYVSEDGVSFGEFLRKLIPGG